MKIVYWSDYACPFCYIGETALKQAIGNLGITEQVQLEMKAFELDPEGSKSYVCPVEELFAAKYGLSAEEAHENIVSINQKGKALGLDMHYDQSRSTNTFDAHRLTKLAADKGDTELTDRLQERLFKAYFTDGLELADHPTLVDLAEEVGLDPEEVKGMLTSDAFASEVRKDEWEAARYRIRMVPCFIIDGKYSIPGAVPVEQFENALQSIEE